MIGERETNKCDMKEIINSLTLESIFWLALPISLCVSLWAYFVEEFFYDVDMD